MDRQLWSSQFKGCFSSFALLGSCLVTTLLLLASSSFAQDAGELLRDNHLPEPPEQQKPAPDMVPNLPSPQAKRRPPFFKISQVDISGVTLFSEADFNEMKRQAMGPTVCLADIEGLAKAIDQFYLSKGYLSRTIIPEQDISSERVQLIVTESRLGQIDLKTPSKGVRFKLDRARELAADGQPDSGLLNVFALQDAMAVLTNTPGVKASAQLLPSVTVEGTDVVIRLEDTKLTDSTVLIDNHGSRFVGQKRLLGFMVLNGPLGFGDQFTGTAVKTEGSQTLAISASVPVLTKDARLSGSVSYLDYKLIDSSTSGKGDALSGYIQLVQPGLLNKDIYSQESLSLSQSHLYDETAGVEAADKIVTTLVAQTQGAWREEAFGGLFSFTASLTVGDVDLSGSRSHKIQDSLTAGTDGRFLKINGEINYNRAIDERRSFQFSARSQHSFDNLDSSQKMSLGGVRGVQAYPTGEASGDAAFLLRAEVRHNIQQGLSGFTFIDVGWLRVNKETWSGWNSGSDVSNEYTLHGIGLGADWIPADKVKVNAVIAHKLGNNPALDDQGNDSDGRETDTRAWMELSVKF